MTVAITNVFFGNLTISRKDMRSFRPYVDSTGGCSSHDTFSSAWRISEATYVQKHDLGEKQETNVQLFRVAVHEK